MLSETRPCFIYILLCEWCARIFLGRTIELAKSGVCVSICRQLFRKLVSATVSARERGGIRKRRAVHPALFTPAGHAPGGESVRKFHRSIIRAGNGTAELLQDRAFTANVSRVHFHFFLQKCLARLRNHRVLSFRGARSRISEKPNPKQSNSV